MSKYYFLNDSEFKYLVKYLAEKKNFESSNIKKSLEYQHNKLKEDNGSYVLAAKNTIEKNLSISNKSEELIVDDDANVSIMNDGAYVQCWLWVENETKPKRNKRQIK
jgi:hypothetical protein